jgi:hypothetical protein
MDTAYENAQRRREVLRKELEEIDLYLRLHQKFSGTETERFAAVKGADVVASHPDGTHEVMEAKRNLPRHMMAKVVHDIMLERRKPMSRTEIVEALELKGHPVAGQDKSKAIGTIMWRLRDKFRNIEGLGYWPIDLPYPPTPGQSFADIFGELPRPALSSGSPEREG